MEKYKANLRQQIRKEYNEKLVHGVSKHKANDKFKYVENQLKEDMMTDQFKILYQGLIG